MLILVLAANTSFADFPRLASFHAGDNFMPRQLTKRGHRLVFSNGIIFLAGFAILLVDRHRRQGRPAHPALRHRRVHLVHPLAGGHGQAPHHATRSRSWRRGLVINGIGAVLSLVVDVIIAVTKFTHGAWVIVVLVPVMVVFLVRLARQYETEADAARARRPRGGRPRRSCAATSCSSSSTELDLAAARAIQYARTLTPDELRAVHFDLDQRRAEELAEAWSQLGLSRIALDLVDCPDRRLTRAAVELVARDLADGRHRGQRAAPRPQVPGLLAPPPPRPDRRRDRARRFAARPTPTSPPSRSTSEPATGDRFASR